MKKYSVNRNNDYQYNKTTRKKEVLERLPQTATPFGVSTDGLIGHDKAAEFNGLTWLCVAS
jgi:hypothetical protein